MPSGIKLKITPEADIPTPAAGKIHLFADDDLAGDAPAYKNAAGAFVPLKGDTGATGAAGSTGPAGLDAYPIDVIDHGACGAAETFDFGDGTVVPGTSGPVHKGELDANLTITLATDTGALEECILTVELVQDIGGGNTVTCPGSVVNAAEVEASIDTAGDAVNLLVFRSTDGGTSWYGLRVAPGPQGNPGADGADGADGEGVPTGGTAGQVLTKQSGTDFDTDWETPSAGTPAFVGCTAFHSTTESYAAAASRAALLDSDENDTDGYHFTSAAALTGTVAKTATSPNIVGTGTSFTTELSVNQVISIPGTATEIGVVKTITDNTNLILWQNMANTASGQTATRRNEYVAIPAGRAGKYRVSASSFINGYSGTSTSHIGISRNGVVFRGTRTTMPTVAAYWTSGSPVVACAEGDYLAVVLANNSSSTQLLGNALAEASTSLSIEFLGA